MPEKPTYEALEQRVRELERDIFESKQAEKTLRHSQEIFNHFLENSPIYVFFKDKDIRSIKLSKNYEQMLGRPLDEILGKTMDELFPPELAKGMIADDKKILNEGKTVVVEEKLNGRYYTTTKFPIFIDGEPLYLAGYTMDITERRKAVDALQKSEAQLRDRNDFIQTILDNLPIGLAVNYFDSGATTYINKRFKEIYGWPEAYLTSVQSFFKNVFPDLDYRKEIQAQIFADIESGDPTRMQWTDVEITTKDGEKRFVSAKNIPLFEQNLMISTVQDVTERKRDEEERDKLQTQLNQAQKMESIGRLAGGVAHDFNNMLSVIIGNAIMAMDKVSQEDPLHRALEEILDAANRSAEITRKLLAFARKQTITPKVLDLNETIKGMLMMLRRLIGEDIDLAWVPGTDIWPVKMDPSQIDQILANLCVNSRDAITNVGKIIIETGRAKLEEAYCTEHIEFIPGDYSMLAVTDNGCGMDSQTLEKIFEPFFTTKGEGKGTGLGMSTVYGIVKQNNGLINVYSEPGKGTTCKIYLPCHKTIPEKIYKKEPVAKHARGNETILIVEDEPAILQMTAMMLEELGYTVLTANTPGQAIDVAREHAGKIHLLITDMIMPEMKGRDLALKLLSFYPNLKHLFMSGYPADVIAHYGMLDEGVNFIKKPFTMSTLAAKMREALDKNGD